MVVVMFCAMQAGPDVFTTPALTLLITWRYPVQTERHQNPLGPVLTDHYIFRILSSQCNHCVLWSVVCRSSIAFLWQHIRVSQAWIIYSLRHSAASRMIFTPSPTCLRATWSFRHNTSSYLYSQMAHRLGTQSCVQARSKTAYIRHHQTQTQTQAPTTRPQPQQKLSFWKCRHTWKRATVNTTRCLIGCSIGDLSTMYYLMTYHPSVNAATSMSISSEQKANR